MKKFLLILCCLGLIREGFTRTAALPNGTFGSLTFSAVNAGSITLNWTNSSTNETGFTIYRSQDNVNFTQVGTTGADTMTFKATGLVARRTYYWRVYAVNADGASSPVSGTRATPAPVLKVPKLPVGQTTSIWGVANAWTPSGVPNEGDSVVISTAMVRVFNEQQCYTLTVSGGILEMASCVLTVWEDCNIGSSGTVRTGTLSATTGVLCLKGDLFNRGTMDLYGGPYNSEIGLLFNSSDDQVFTCYSGSIELSQSIGATGGLHVDKPASSTLVFTPAGTWGVEGTDSLGFLSINSGAFELSGFTYLNNRVWSSASYTIPASGSFRLNNPNVTVRAQAGSATLAGKLRISSGTYNVGTAADHSLLGGVSTSSLQIESGTLNVAGRINLASGTYNQSAGTVTVCTVGNTLDATPSFNVTGAGSSFTMSGGMIYLQNAASGSNPVDFDTRANTVSVTGGMLQLGNGATTGTPNFGIAGSVDSFLAYSPSIRTTLKGALNIMGICMLQYGSKMLSLNDHTLTLYGPLNGSGEIVGSPASAINIQGTGSVSTLNFDQSVPGISNRLKDLTYNRSGQTINLGNQLEVTGTITPTAGSLSTNNNLTLVSDSSGTARIAQGSGYYINGNVKVQRYIQSVARRWRFLSTPVSYANLEDWRKEIFITGAGNGSTPGTLNDKGFDATSTNFPGVARYNEANTKPYADSGWIFITNTTSSLTNVQLTVGMGYRVFVRGDRSSINRLNGTDKTQNAVTMDLTGNINTGNITMPVSFTSSGTAAADGWSFLGNPYPSPIDWNAIHDAGRTGTNPNFSGTSYARISPSVYIYDATANSYKGYNAVSNSGTLTGGIIPSGCSFFVQATAASPSLTLTEAHKTAGLPAVYHKTTEEELYIRASVDPTNYDECIIKYSNGSAAGYDDHDMLKLFNADINIGTYLDGSHLMLDARPSRNEDDTFFLNISARATGEYSLVFSGIENFAAGYEIYLIDRFMGTVTDLRQTPSCHVKIDKNDASSEGYGRLMIVFKKNGTVGIEQLQLNNQAAAILYPTVTSGITTVFNSSLPGKYADVVVRDMTGRVVLSQRQVQWCDHRLQLDLSSCSPGIYLVELTDQTQAEPLILKCIRQ